VLISQVFYRESSDFQAVESRLLPECVLGSIMI